VPACIPETAPRALQIDAIRPWGRVRRHRASSRREPKGQRLAEPLRIDFCMTTVMSGILFARLRADRGSLWCLHCVLRWGLWILDVLMSAVIRVAVICVGSDSYVLGSVCVCVLYRLRRLFRSGCPYSSDTLGLLVLCEKRKSVIAERIFGP